MQVGNWTLVDKTTGEPVERGDIIMSFRGDTYYLLGGDPPHKFGASGYVYTRYAEDGKSYDGRYYASVFNLVWKDTTNG
jgi:hypothetical protein